jgi:transposase
MPVRPPSTEKQDTGGWCAHRFPEVLIALRCLESPDLGNEDGAMPKEQESGKPQTRRYSPTEKAAAVRMVRPFRAELGTEHGRCSGSRPNWAVGSESTRP